MFRVEKHDNSYEYFSSIDLSGNALHITSNLSLEKLFLESSNDDKNKWKIKSIDHLLGDIYPNLYDSINVNRLKIELRNILINNDVDQNLMQEDNLSILFSDFKFLIESGIRLLPNMDDINDEQETIICIFNQFVQSKSVQSIIKELSSATNLKNMYMNKASENIQKIYLYNFNNLHLSRMVFFNRLKYLGYEVVFRIPQFNIDSVDEPWKNLYTTKIFKWDNSSYKRYNQIEKNAYIDYIVGNEINNDNKKIIFKEFLGSFEFRNQLENDKNKDVSYYALDTTLINQVFDIDEDKAYNMPLIRFMMNMYNCRNKDGELYINYGLLTELITSGWIEIKEGNRIINGIDYLDFMKNLESYFEGVDTIEGIIERIEELRYLKLASDTMENEVKQKVGKNKVYIF